MNEIEKKTLKTLEYDKILERLSQFAVTEGGKGLALALTPSSSAREVRENLADTERAKELIGRKGNPDIAAVQDVRGPLARAEKGGMMSLQELLRTAQILRCARKLLDYLEEERGEGQLFELFSLLRPNRALEERISFVVLSEEELNDNASPELADIRRKLRNAAGKAKDILNRIVHNSGKYLQDQIITLRGDRYCIPVRAEYRSEIPGLVHDVSGTGATLFVEPMAVVEANNELRELEAQEQAEVERILYELSARCADFRQSIEDDLSLIAEIDFIFAKAKLSYAQNGMCPAVNEKGRVVLNRARHPLIDPKTVVPISVNIGCDFSTLVITGPNTGGKTVTLKTLGLLVLMAESGLHIPAADESEISIFDHILSDIGDEQSIEQSLSTFSAHMSNIVKILEVVDQSTLVLFDELGAGTDPVEGAALSIAVLERVKAFGARCAATTHYAELKAYALQTAGVENASCEFDVATLRPTYRLLIGVPGKSNAFAISTRLGLDESIVARARALVDEEAKQFDEVLADLERKRQDFEARSEEAEALRRELAQMRAELQAEREKFDAGKDAEVRKQREQAKRLLATVKGLYENVTGELDALKKEKDAADFSRRLAETKKQLSRSIDLAEDGFTVEKKEEKYTLPRKLRIGDSVSIKTLNKDGTVLELPDAKGDVVVRAGMIKTKVHVSALRLKEETAPKKRTSPGRGTHKGSGERVKRELDLRGMLVSEAEIALEQYLDSAMLMGIGEIVVIHGKGTGAVRNAVRNLLKGHRLVKSFRPGVFGEGDDGVTVVTLK